MKKKFVYVFFLLAGGAIAQSFTMDSDTMNAFAGDSLLQQRDATASQNAPNATTIYYTPQVVVSPAVTSSNNVAVPSVQQSNGDGDAVDGKDAQASSLGQAFKPLVSLFNFVVEKVIGFGSHPVQYAVLGPADDLTKGLKEDGSVDRLAGVLHEQMGWGGRLDKANTAFSWQVSKIIFSVCLPISATFLLTAGGLAGIILVARSGWQRQGLLPKKDVARQIAGIFKEEQVDKTFFPATKKMKQLLPFLAQESVYAAAGKGCRRFPGLLLRGYSGACKQVVAQWLATKLGFSYVHLDCRELVTLVEQQKIPLEHILAALPSLLKGRSVVFVQGCDELEASANAQASDVCIKILKASASSGLFVFSSDRAWKASPALQDLIRDVIDLEPLTSSERAQLLCDLWHKHGVGRGMSAVCAREKIVSLVRATDGFLLSDFAEISAMLSCYTGQTGRIALILDHSLQRVKAATQAKRCLN